ncbi:hypothetical protein HAHE_06500 [Haloferula helveola]|uniref:SbsA Ig-like domain-containing protein n=1 Tax=Haloferula helveola TaxID=490095 RepID=A0ABM7RG65_9BACT|nr:hypothetical protein HAHE_06500 [Haloferula helveola]
MKIPILPFACSASLFLSFVAPLSGQGISVFTANTAGDSMTTSDLVHTFDTTVRNALADHNLSGTTDFQMSAGHHLVLYNSYFFKDPTGLGTNDRSEIQTNLNLAGTDLSEGWSQGYIRVQNGQNETITSGGAIIEVASAGDVLQLQSFRSDSDTNGMVRENSGTGIQLLKLDDSWDYLRITGTGADQPLPNDITTWLPVNYNTELEKDAASFAFAAGGSDVTLAGQGHYLLFANTFIEQPSNRDAVVQRLTLDGTEVTGSKTCVYIRGNADGCSSGAAALGMIIETSSANQVLNVQIRQEQARPGDIIGAQTALTIVKLPDTGDFVRLEDLSNDQNLNAATPTVLVYDDAGAQLEVDAAFTHSTSTDPGRVGVSVSGDYLFLSTQFDENDGVQRGFYQQGWQVNGSGGIAIQGQTGRYSRDSGTNRFGNWSGFISALNPTDYVETLTQALGNVGTNTADALTLQGLRLDNLFGPDVTDPTLIEVSPPDNQPDVFAGDALIASFSEGIALVNGGTVTIVEDPNGSPSSTVLTIPDGQLSVSGNQLTIAPTGGLGFDTEYAIQISADAVDDLAAVPNSFAGILDNTTWNFTTLPLDTADPVVDTLNPADDSTAVSIFNPSLVITFDEIVEAGTGNIELVRVGDSTVIATVDITDSAAVSIVDEVVTVNVATVLDVGTEYAVRIDSGALTDRSANSFGGISDLTTWSFTTETFPTPAAYWPMRDGLPGSAFSGADDVIDDPSHGATDASPDGSSIGHAWAADPFRGVVYSTPEDSRLDAGTQDINMDDGFTWSLWVKTDGNQNADAGADVVFGSRSGVWNKLQVTAWQRWVDIGGYNLDDGEWHHVLAIGSKSPGTLVSLYVDGAFVGSDSSLFNNTEVVNDSLEIGGSSSFDEDMAGLISDVAVWDVALPVDLIDDLYTDSVVLAPDTTAPVLAATTPVDEEPSAAGNFLQAIFDEPVVLGTGDIRIVNTTDAITTTIAVTDGSQVTVSGASISISPTMALQSGKSYAVEMDAGVVTSFSSGLPFAGIPDQTTWNFVIEAVPPTLVTLNPVDDSLDVNPAANLVVTFDEPMAAGSGNIEVKNLTDAVTTNVDVTGSEVSIAGTVVTINPAALLTPGKSYAVQIPAGVLTDVSGNAFGGILNDTDWSFTTGTPPTGLIVYEGFQYADPSTNDILGGQPDDAGVTDVDATGLAGTWNDASGGNSGNTMYLIAGSLAYGDHVTLGNHVGFNTNSDRDIYHRDPTPAAQLGISGNPEIWFSFLADKVLNSFSAAEGGVAITNQIVANSEIVLNTGGDGLVGFGIAPTGSGNNWTAYAWDGSSQVAGDAALPVSIGANDVRLLVGRISFDAGAGGADVFTIFEYQLSGSNTVAGGALSQIASPIEVDVDQTVLDTLNVTRQVSTSYDEIRIGTSLADVVPGAGAPASPYSDWVIANGLSGGDELTTADVEPDGLVNLLEFAFGTDPNASDNGTLVADGSVNGVPIIQTSGGGGGITFNYMFVRRKDYGASGSVSYTPQFSSQLGGWYNSTATPTFVADSTDDPDYEVVSVPYPALLPDGKKARFARMEINEVP